MATFKAIYWFFLPGLLCIYSADGQGAGNDSTIQTQSHYKLLNATDMLSQAALHEAAAKYPLEAAAAAAAATAAAGLSSPQEKHLTRTSVIFGLTKMANETNVNSLCRTQLWHMQRSILAKQPWAMKVLDASGTKPSGFVYGQNYWLGSREACGGVQRPVGITLSRNFERVMHYGIITQRAPFDMDYRVLYLRHQSPWQVEIKLMSEQIIHIGLCLPSACEAQEIQQLTSEYVASGMFTENTIFDIRPQVLYMKNLQLRDAFYQRKSFKLLVACVLLTCTLMLCAQQLSSGNVSATAVAAKSTELGDASATGLPPAESELWRALHALLKRRSLQTFASCFEVPSNWNKIFAARENRANEIPLMNGLRSVCAIWIMVFHVVWYMYFTVHNKTVLISYAEQAFFQFVSSAPLLVDAFFTISGFLQIYNFIRNVPQMRAIRGNNFQQNLQLFGKLLFHRYLRLGPLYLVVMGTVDLVYAYIGDVSVFHINERLDEICAQHWWRNLLFIQNLFDHREMCANWSWSLACDMQFFIIANLLLFLYVRFRRYVQNLTCLGLIATICWTFVVGIRTKFELSFDAAFATGTDIYTSPFVRIMPYIMGAITAWSLLRHPRSWVMSDLKERCLWHLSLLVFFICIYSTIKRDISSVLAISLFVMGRLAFSMSICWMIVGSATGRGVWWSRLLETKCFQHLSRLSYAIYLLNPLIIAFFYSMTNASTHADPLMLCVVTCGFAVIVYLMSIIFSLAFELPYTNLSGLLLKCNIKPKIA